MSPRPHLFGTPPPRTPSSTTSTSSSTLNSTSSSNPSATSDHPRVPGMSPDLPARVLPSDLLTMEDYRKIRYEATKRTFLYGAVGALVGVLGVRQFARGKMGPNGLVLVGFGMSPRCCSSSSSSSSFSELCYNLPPCQSSSPRSFPLRKWILNGQQVELNGHQGIQCVQVGTAPESSKSSFCNNHPTRGHSLPQAPV